MERTRKATGPSGPVTLPPQVVGSHYYSLLIDNATVSDPSSETFLGVGRD